MNIKIIATFDKHSFKKFENIFIRSISIHILLKVLIFTFDLSSNSITISYLSIF